MSEMGLRIKGGKVEENSQSKMRELKNRNERAQREEKLTGNEDREAGQERKV